MAEFATMDSGSNIPFSGSSVSDNALGLTNPDSILSGGMRGTQQVGTGAMIDAANNRILIKNSYDNSSIGFGSIPGSTTEIGFFALDSSKNLIMKIVNGTWYVYDIANNKNIMQTGKLPDSTYGITVAKTGYNVSEVYS
jgi:hypothetical protein